MTNNNFKRFFDDVIAPAQAATTAAFDKVPLPAGISEEAKLFLSHDKGPTPPIDITDRTQRQVARDLLDTMWGSAERYLDIEFKARIEPIAGVNCKIFTPKALKTNKQKLLYLHGGAYWLGSAEANSSIAINMADKAGLEVVSVDYRLAPEHPFPAAQEDMLAVYKALLASGIAPLDIAVFGDSAGGGLALSAATEIVARSLPKPAALGLIAPWVDLTHSGDSHQTHNMYVDTRLGVEGLSHFAKAYAGSKELSTPGISPLFANLENLPPMLIQVGSREILLSDATRLAKRARLSGVDVTLDVYEAMWHVWQFYPHVPEANQAVTEMADFLTTQMG